jgi:hypothetical protein
MGSPLPPRRLHGHEVFRRPASSDPKVLATPSDLGALPRAPSRCRSRARRHGTSPPGVSCPSNGHSDGGPLIPGLPHPARSAHGVSHPLDGFLPPSACGHEGRCRSWGFVRSAHRSRETSRRRGATPSSSWAREAPHPLALRNKRSSASSAVGAFWLAFRLTAAEAAAPDGFADLLDFLLACAKPPGPKPRRCVVSHVSFRHRPKPPPSGPVLDEIRPRASVVAVPEGPAAELEGLAS